MTCPCPCNEKECNYPECDPEKSQAKLLEYIEWVKKNKPPEKK